MKVSMNLNTYIFLGSCAEIVRMRRQEPADYEIDKDRIEKIINIIYSNVDLNDLNKFYARGDNIDIKSSIEKLMDIIDIEVDKDD